MHTAIRTTVETVSAAKDNAAAELAGLLIVASTPIPADVALDNKSVVQKAQAFLKWCSMPGNEIEFSSNLDVTMSPKYATTFPSAPFYRCKDGDLWYQVVRAFMSSGLASIRVSWAKGHGLSHPTWLLENPQLREEAVYNDMADQDADRAIVFCFLLSCLYIYNYI